MKKFIVFFEKFNLKKIWQRLKEEKFSFFYLFSVFLLRTGINLPFKFLYYKNLYLKLQPSSITLNLWRKRYLIEADISLIENIVKEDFICIDVGANIGHLSQIMAKKASKGLVFAIEPSRKNFIFLLNNIELNKIENIIPLNFAIQENNKLENFYDYVYADDQSSFVKAYEWKTKTYKVPALKLETFINLFNVEKIDFLKIDVEGAELNVIKSLGKNLSKVKYIWFEFIEENYKNFNYTGKDILDYLKQNHFIVQKFNLNNSSFKEIRNYDQLKDYRGNLLAINLKKEKI